MAGKLHVQVDGLPASGEMPFHVWLSQVPDVAIDDIGRLNDRLIFFAA